MSDEDKELENLLEQATPTKFNYQEQDRLSFNTAIAINSPDAEPVGLNLVGSIIQDASGEDVYRRRMSVGPNWKEVELGWCDDPLLIVIDNRPARGQVNPTQAELDAQKGQIVGICIGAKEPQPHLTVERGMFQVLTPSPGVKVFVYAVEELKIPITVVQRCQKSSS